MTSAEFEAFMNQMDSLSARLDKQRAKFEKEKVQIDDKSPEAREVRGYLAQNMSYVRDSVEDADDEDNEAAQARVALDKGMTRLREWESQYAAQRNQAS